MDLETRTVDLLPLRTLCAVVACGSFRGAADELMMAPSTVQKYMRAFEADWQIRLFDRVGREIRVREEAMHLAAAIQPILFQTQELANCIEAIRTNAVT